MSKPTYIAKRVENLVDHFGKWEQGVLLYDDTQAGFICPCGCLNPVVLRIGPGNAFCQGSDSYCWSFAVNDDRPTLSPSVHQTGYVCKSHYFLRDGQIQWC